MTELSAMEEGETEPYERQADISIPANARSNQKRLILILLGVVSIAALAVGLGVGLSNNNNNPGTNYSYANAETSNSSGGSLNSSVNKSGTISAISPSNSSGGSLNPSVNTIGTISAISPKSIRQSYSSCDALSKDLMEAARLLVNLTIESNAQNINNPHIYFASAPGGAPLNGAADASKAPITESSYGTNNQVNGVEEGDIVVSNGVQVFAAYGREVVQLDTNNVTILSRTELPALPANCSSDGIANMLLIGDLLLVISYTYCDNNLNVPSGGLASARIVMGQGNTRVTVYNITNMNVYSAGSFQGDYISARAIGENVHIVTNSWLNSYDFLLQYLDPWRSDIYGDQPTESAYRAKAQVEAQQHLMPFVEQLTQELDCTSVQKLALLQNTNDFLDFSGILNSMASVTSFSAPDQTSTTSTTTMLLPDSGWQVYASEDRLVLASQGWWIQPDVNQTATQQTYLITYKLDGPTATASTLGTVPGYVLNQFSIDHAKQNGTDYLRVASSTQQQWAFFNGAYTSTDKSTSQVTVLEINDSSDSMMPMVGQLNDLGKPGEQIFSVRFLGDRGFVVTFQQTDPFFTLDLSDPSNPKIVGELQIPGYSNYLHPIGNNLIVGVGQGVNDQGVASGFQISLFDVSNFKQPRRVQNFQEQVSNVSSSYSEAQYDSKAFRYLPENQLLILPLTIYTYSAIDCQIPVDPPLNNTGTNVTGSNDTTVVPAGNGTSSGGTSTGGSGGTSTGSSGGTSTGNATVVGFMPISSMPITCSKPTGGFDGFRLYKIDATNGITEYLSIEHASGDFYNGCWSASGYLQPRAMVFSGEIMTFKGHSILSHDLTTKLQNAAPINLDTGLVNCSPNYFIY